MLNVTPDSVDETLAMVSGADIGTSIQVSEHQTVLDRGLNLSGGQRQRLALARGLALLDEPSYSQDLNGTRSIARMILAGSQERVTLMATHDRLIVDALATHVAHVADGELKDLVER